MLKRAEEAEALAVELADTAKLALETYKNAVGNAPD
jgi:hypothetical protein